MARLIGPSQATGCLLQASTAGLSQAQPVLITQATRAPRAATPRVQRSGDLTRLILPVQQPRSSVPASAARVSDGNHPGVQSSTQNLESWRPHEPQVQHPKSSEPVKAADAGKVQGPAGVMLHGSRAPSDRTDRSTSTYLSREVLPEAALSPRSTSSHSSSMRHNQSAANGNVQPSTASAHAAGSVAQRNASHGTPTKQVPRKSPAKFGDEDDIPDSFCCPITQVSAENQTSS